MLRPCMGMGMKEEKTGTTPPHYCAPLLLLLTE